MIWMWVLGCGKQSIEDSVDTAEITESVVDANAGNDIYVTIGNSVTLDASSSSGISLEWNLGDGTTQTGNTIEHTYSDIGRKRVVLTATGEHGETDSDIVNVVVHNPLFEIAPQSNHAMVVLEVQKFELEK